MVRAGMKEGNTYRETRVSRKGRPVRVELAHAVERRPDSAGERPIVENDGNGREKEGFERVLRRLESWSGGGIGSIARGTNQPRQRRLGRYSVPGGQRLLALSSLPEGLYCCGQWCRLGMPAGLCRPRVRSKARLKVVASPGRDG